MSPHKPPAGQSLYDEANVKNMRVRINEATATLGTDILSVDSTIFPSDWSPAHRHLAACQVQSILMKVYTYLKDLHIHLFVLFSSFHKF